MYELEKEESSEPRGRLKIKDLLHMNSKTEDQEMNVERLTAEYKAAFEEWAAQVGRLQALSESEPDSWVVDEVRAKADAAQAAYRETRDELACMVSGR